MIDRARQTPRWIDRSQIRRPIFGVPFPESTRRENQAAQTGVHALDDLASAPTKNARCVQQIITIDDQRHHISIFVSVFYDTVDDHHFGAASKLGTVIR